MACRYCEQTKRETLAEIRALKARHAEELRLAGAEKARAVKVIEDTCELRLQKAHETIAELKDQLAEASSLAEVERDAHDDSLTLEELGLED